MIELSVRVHARFLTILCLSRAGPRRMLCSQAMPFILPNTMPSRKL